MFSLDVHEAFDSAWCPAILQGLREAKFPRKLYYLAQDYLKERKAIITKFQHGKERNKGLSARILLWPFILERPI